MIQLNFGNVLITPAQRKHLQAQFRRAIRLGKQIGSFAIAVTLRRRGRMVEITANVSDREGSFACRRRRHTVKDAMRELANAVVAWVHAQRLGRTAPVSAN